VNKLALLMSGGMDSIALAWELRPDLCITVDYGQRAAEGEIRASAAVCETLNLKHRILKIDCSSLGSGDMSESPALSMAPASEWWPFRNQLLITFAAAVAIQEDISRIAIGTVANDGTHADGRADFVKAMAFLLSQQEGRIALEAPGIGKPIEIDPGRQRLLREWAVKTAMINDSTKVRNGIAMFYTAEEHAAMRGNRAMPAQTRIWLGKIDEDWHIGIHGTDFTITNGTGLRFGEGTVTTIYIGCFLVQVVTEHIKPEYAHPEFRGVNPKPRNWDQKLIETWPTVSKKVLWPPPIPFMNGGPEGIAYLMDRWRMGAPVMPGTI
jgi:7-cyano-7-deazaguanine synthase